MCGNGTLLSLDAVLKISLLSLEVLTNYKLKIGMKSILAVNYPLNLENFPLLLLRLALIYRSDIKSDSPVMFARKN